MVAVHSGKWEQEVQRTGGRSGSSTPVCIRQFPREKRCASAFSRKMLLSEHLLAATLPARVVG